MRRCARKPNGALIGAANTGAAELVLASLGRGTFQTAKTSAWIRLAEWPATLPATKLTKRQKDLAPVKTDTLATAGLPGRYGAGTQGNHGQIASLKKKKTTRGLPH